jgi:sarcosine oxidase gamma subunit
MNNTQKPEILSVDVAARKYADARDVLSHHLDDFDTELKALRRRHLSGIKQAAGVAAQRKSELAGAVVDARAAFDDPKTQVLHGIKVGFEKGKGRVTARIDQVFRQEADQYLIITRKPSKAALLTLDAAMLKRLGVKIESDGDQVVIRATGTDIDKLVAKILEEGTESGKA